jgi:hypothetical protein
MRSMRERNDAAGRAEQVVPKPREAGRHNCIVLSRLFVASDRVCEELRETSPRSGLRSSRTRGAHTGMTVGQGHP